MSYQLNKPYTDKQRIDFIVHFNHNQGLIIEETDKAIYALETNEIMVDGEPTIDPDYEAKKKQKEKERISEIALTRADVFEALILARGLTKQMLRSFIEQDETLNDIEKALYLNRFDDALEFYRKHPAIDFIAEKLDISTDAMDKFFDTKDYTYLKPVEKVINPDEPIEETPVTDGVLNGEDVNNLEEESK